MYIVIHASGLPFNGATIPTGESLGGSETAAYEMARELAKIGHRVLVFTSSQKLGKWENVTYEWMGQVSDRFPLGDRFHFTMQAPHDVLIIQRHPAGFMPQYNSKLNIWWLHDLGLYRHTGFVSNGLLNIDKIFTVSEFHKEQISKVYGINNKSIIVPTTNGVDYSMFEGLNFLKREPRSLIYTARPERGLENLVGKDGIMRRLKNCNLYVCSYKNTAPQMKDYYAYLWDLCKRLPNVYNLGFLGKAELYKAEAKAMLHVYPTNFEDTSCIAAMEAQAAGTPFIGSEVAALPETLKDSGSVLIPLKDKQVNIDKFIKTIEWLLKDSSQWGSLHKKALSKKYLWSNAAKQWTEVFETALKEKSSSNKLRLHKHLEKYSDIMAAIKDGACMPGFKDNYHFIYSGNYKEHYEKYYQREKDRGVKYGVENLDGNSRFEAVAETIINLRPKSVLDYGCAHGHYIMNLAKRMPDTKFDGFDIDKSNIETAMSWHKNEDDARVKSKTKTLDINFYEGTHTDIPEDKKYDVIIAAEILEHVPDPQKLVTSLMKHLNPEGTMIINTPYGAWESIGYEEHRGWRAHIHHFERQDLSDIFGGQKEYRLIAIPHVGANMLGNYLLTFKASEKPLGEIDLERKLNTQAPKETVSVCMIVRNVEDSLGKTLKSVKSFADEIIIGIDANTTDKTKEIAKAHGAIIFEIESPMKQGFDRARNLTIMKATMDWVLWIDADETFEEPNNLTKYLRPNCYDGYAIKQHHFAVDPLGCFKTDMPIRLFRNHKGICFYGHVHEHPEKGLNKGIGKIMVLQDVSIMHTGYSTENIRRERFKRNFPLMLLDRKRHPNRILGKFLWLRDLAHLIRYTLESNGGMVTQEIINHCNEIIKLWREFAAGKDIRLTIDALQFYSEAVSILTGGSGGTKFEFECAVSKFNGRPPQSQKVGGLFLDKADIKILLDKVAESKLAIYDEKYY